MSIRTLLEINHDYIGQNSWLKSLAQFLRSGPDMDRRLNGVMVWETRHHSTSSMMDLALEAIREIDAIAEANYCKTPGTHAWRMKWAHLIEAAKESEK